MNKPVLLGHTPVRGVAVYNLLSDEAPLWPLLAHRLLARPDETVIMALTAQSVLVDTVQAVAPTAGAGTAIGAKEVAGKQPIISIAEIG